MWIRLQKILMDQTIYLSVKCSIYISAVGLLQGDDIQSVRNNVQTKLPSIVLTAWKFWPLVHLVTYGVIPARHRILWVNCVDLVWNAILATMSQKKEVSPTEDEVQPIVLEATIQDSNMIVLDAILVSDDTLTSIDNETYTEANQGDLVMQSKFDELNNDDILVIANVGNNATTTIAARD
jgi:Mpv17 / PMP22 family